MKSVLVVGCGITGSTIAHLLSRRLAGGLPGAAVAATDKLQNGVRVEIWDKGSRPGGRFTTYVDKETGATCDMGCQVVVPNASAKLGYPADMAMYGLLRDQELLQPLSMQAAQEGGYLQPQQGGEAFVGSATGGMTAVSKWLTQGVRVRQRMRVIRVDHKTSGGDGRGKWVVRSEGGDVESFDAVVLTQPAPQILTDVGGDVQGLLQSSGVAKDLAHATYCSKYALGLVFPPSSRPFFDALPWTLHCPTSDPVVSKLSLEHRKRHSETPTLLVHSTPAFGDKHIDADKKTVSGLLQEAASRLLPGLPTPSATKLNKWKYSQVTTRVPGDHMGALALRAGGGRGPVLVLAGDAFSDSTLDGCIQSAKRAVDLLEQEGQ